MNKSKVLSLLFIAFLILAALISLPYFFKESPRISLESEYLKEIDSKELQALIKSSRAPVKLVNVWATWCAPCIEEFPILLKLRKDYLDQGLELIFVSADMPEERQEVLEFLESQKVDFVTYLKTEDDQNFIDNLNPDWSGGLPASLIYNKYGELAQFWVGDATYKEFEEKILKQMNVEKENSK